MENYEFISTIAVVIIAAVAVGGLVLRLEGRISRLEGLIEGYFHQETQHGK